MDENTIIYIVSDSAGETAELVVKAATSQFLNKNIELHRIPYVEDEGTINEVIMQAKETNGLIAFTLVVPEIRDYLKEEAKKLSIPTYDILSPMMNMLEERFRSAPRNEPGVMHMLDDDYYRKVEAIEFAVKYDDGRDPRGILRADFVLIGVSRTSKTPLSQYLAHKRLKVANVPIVPEVDPPKELFKIPKEKIFGLTINPEKLNSIRTERLKSLGLKAEANYANFDRIKEELAYSNEVMKKLGCQVVDVSNRAVEETANLIYQMNLKLKENE